MSKSVEKLLEGKLYGIKTAVASNRRHDVISLISLDTFMATLCDINDGINIAAKEIKDIIWVSVFDAYKFEANFKLCVPFMYLGTERLSFDKISVPLSVDTLWPRRRPCAQICHKFLWNSQILYMLHVNNFPDKFHEHFSMLE